MWYLLEPLVPWSENQMAATPTALLLNQLIHGTQVPLLWDVWP